MRVVLEEKERLREGVDESAEGAAYIYTSATFLKRERKRDRKNQKV